MPDLQIPAPGVKAAPLIYTVPGSVEMIVKAAFATFDGSGAGGAFLPCLRVLSPAGLVVGEYVTDASVAAGSSAEVSFAPFLRGQSPGATQQLGAYAQLGRDLSAWTPDSGPIEWETFFTTDGAVFATSSSPPTISNTIGDRYLLLLAPGAYVIHSSARFTNGTYSRGAGLGTDTVGIYPNGLSMLEGFTANNTGTTTIGIFGGTIWQADTVQVWTNGTPGAGIAAVRTTLNAPPAGTKVAVAYMVVTYTPTAASYSQVF